VIFFFWACLKDTVYNSNPWTEELKKNIYREIANIPAEQLQRVNQNLLWSGNCNCFFPNVICQQANSYPPRSQPCTDRCEPVNKGKNFPVYPYTKSHVLLWYILSGYYFSFWQNNDIIPC
jgi:hypothetical protein